MGWNELETSSSSSEKTGNVSELSTNIMGCLWKSCSWDIEQEKIRLYQILTLNIKCNKKSVSLQVDCKWIWIGKNVVPKKSAIFISQITKFCIMKLSVMRCWAAGETCDTTKGQRSSPSGRSLPRQPLSTSWSSWLSSQLCSSHSQRAGRYSGSN